MRYNLCFCLYSIINYMPEIVTKPKVLSAMSGGVGSALATQLLQADTLLN